MHFTAAPSSDRINACTAGYDAARIQREEFMMNMAVVSLIALAEMCIRDSHYITFVALLTGDSLMLRKLYPEWNLQTRIPRFGHGMLVWNCSRHGLFWQAL